MRNRTIRNRAFQIAFGVLAIFLLMYFFLPYDRFKLYLDAGRVGIWTVVWAVTLPVAVHAFWARHREQGEVVAMALHLVSAVILLQSVWIPVNRELGHLYPVWIGTLVSPLIVLGYIVAGAFFLLPIGNKIGVTPPRNWWFLLWAGIIGSLVAGIMIGIGIQASPG